MECERLQRLVKNWYTQVQDESMAPARMVLFMENHLADCQTCLADPLVRQEVDKIIAIVLPPSKLRKPSSALEEGEDFLPEPEEETVEGEEDEGSDESEDESGDEEISEEDEFDEDEEDDI